MYGVQREIKMYKINRNKPQGQVHSPIGIENKLKKN